jgi:hypothetical protein
MSKQMNKNEIEIDDYTKQFSKIRMDYYKSLYAMEVLR